MYFHPHRIRLGQSSVTLVFFAFFVAIIVISPIYFQAFDILSSILLQSFNIIFAISLPLTCINRSRCAHPVISSLKCTFFCHFWSSGTLVLGTQNVGTHLLTSFYTWVPCSQLSAKCWKLFMSSNRSVILYSLSMTRLLYHNEFTRQIGSLGALVNKTARSKLEGI